MDDVKTFLFARWMAINFESLLNAQSGYWWKERLLWFNLKIYPEYIRNDTVKETKEFLKNDTNN